MSRKSWYVLQSKPQKESVVCVQLQRVSKIIEVFFPKIRNYLGVRPLFPSYLFVRTEMGDIKNYQLVKYTRGVLRILSTQDEGPIPVPDHVVEVIQGHLSASGLIDQRILFKSGSSVRVTKGPLKDLIGILEKPTSDQARVQVLFKLLKYPMRAILRLNSLAVVPM